MYVGRQAFVRFLSRVDGGESVVNFGAMTSFV